MYLVYGKHIYGKPINHMGGGGGGGGGLTLIKKNGYAVLELRGLFNDLFHAFSSKNMTKTLPTIIPTYLCSF